MMAGIVVNSWFDLEFSIIGSWYGLASVLVTAIYTVVSIVFSIYVIFYKTA